MIDWFMTGFRLFELNVLISKKYSDDENLKKYMKEIENAARLCYCISFIRDSITDVIQEIESI